MPEDTCPKITFYAPSSKLGGDKPIPSCVPPVVKVPEVLYKPEGTEESEIPLNLPRPIELINTEQIATCETAGKTGSEGADAVVQAGDFQALIVFDSVPGIDREALDYIASNNYENDIEQLLRDGLLTSDYLVKFGLTKSQADEFIKLANDTIDMLNKSAFALASSMLECYWSNKEVTATCPDDAARTGQHVDAIWSHTVPAGHVKSLISQADADKQAKIIAETSINCLYLSSPVKADCVTRPDAPAEGLEPVPNDTEPVYEGLIPRKGTVELPAGSVVSDISVADATAQAQAMAYSMLVCYYVNEEVTEKCLTPDGEFAEDARNQGVDPADPNNPSITITVPSKGQTGQTVIVPEGYITSELSTALATEEARVLAQSLLECCYMNDEITLTCPPYTYTVFDKETGEALSKEIPATKITDDPNEYSVTIPRGTIISCTSQEDVNAQAISIAESSLVCNYCNTKILPVCVPEWVRQAADGGIILDQAARIPVWNPVKESYTYRNLNAGDLYVIELPLNQDRYYNPVTHQEEEITAWSEDATIGAAEGEFCGPSYEQSQQVADSTSGLQVEIIYKKSKDTCTYTNDLLIAGCNFADPYNGTTAPAGSMKLQYLKGVNKDTGEVYFLYRENTDPKLSGVSGKEYRGVDPTKFSSPAIGSYVSIPAGTIAITEEDVPESYEGPADIPTESWEDQTDEEGNPLPPEPGIVPYPGLSGDIAREQRIKAYANTLALEMAKAMVDCQYINYYLSAACGVEAAKFSPAASTSGDGELWEVPAGSFSGPVLRDVMASAESALGAGPVCLYPNDPIPCSLGCDRCGTPPDNIVISNLTIDNPLPTGYVVPYGSFYDVTVEKANEKARAMCSTLTSVAKCTYSYDTEAGADCSAACSVYGINLSLTAADKQRYSWLELNPAAGEIKNDSIVVKADNSSSGSATCETLYIAVSALCKAKCEAVSQIAFTQKEVKNIPCKKNSSKTWSLPARKFVGTKDEVVAMVELWECAQCAEGGVSCGDHAFDVCTRTYVESDSATETSTQYMDISVYGGRIQLANNCYLDIPDKLPAFARLPVASEVTAAVKLSISTDGSSNYTWYLTYGNHATAPETVRAVCR